MPFVFRSPFSGDEWSDVLSAIGTIAGLANFLNEKRPRRKPPEGFDAMIALATDAAGSIAGIPKIIRADEIQGRAISDAYWQAKDVKVKLTPIVGELFLRRQEWWGRSWQEYKAEGRKDGGLYDYGNVQEDDARNASTSLRAARLAWYAARLVEKAVAVISTPNGLRDLLDLDYGANAALGAAAEMEIAGYDSSVTAPVERVWRFVVAAGRMPIPGVDDDVLAAFEAALIAGESDFAIHLAKHGYGVTLPPASI